MNDCPDSVTDVLLARFSYLVKWLQSRTDQRSVMASEIAQLQLGIERNLTDAADFEALLAKTSLTPDRQQSFTAERERLRELQVILGPDSMRAAQAEAFSTIAAAFRKREQDQQ